MWSNVRVYKQPRVIVEKAFLDDVDDVLEVYAKELENRVVDDMRASNAIRDLRKEIDRLRKIER